MPKIAKYIALFLITFLAPHFTRSIESLASVIITENNNEFDFYQNITRQVLIAESSEGLKVENKDLTDPDILFFAPLAKAKISLPYSSKIRWFKFTIQNASNQPIKKYLVFDAPINGTIFVIDQRAYVLDKIGSSVIGSNFNTQINVPFSKVELLPFETKVFYWAMSTRHNVSGEFVLTNNPQVVTKDQDYIIMFYTGGILALFFFNLLTYIFTREYFYKAYLIYVGTFLLFVLNIKGKLDQWFYIPHFTFAQHLIFFSAALAVSTLLFTHSFLSIRIYRKSHFIVYRSMIIYFTTLGILGLTPVHDWLSPFPGHAIDTGIMLACFYMILMGIISLRKNKIFSIIFLLSWSFVFMGVFTWFGMKWEIIPSNIITDNILLIASLLEMSTLSLGISIRQLEWQKEKSLIGQKASEKEKFERLLRVLTHDLANPLTLILANSKRLLTKDELTFQHPSLEKIYFSAENMKKVLTKVREEELLNLTSTEHSYSNIVECVKYSLMFFEDQLQKKHIAVELNLNKEIHLEIDRTIFINNILNNILSNAIKFSHIGGKIKITALTTNKDILLEIRDFGVGINPETIDLVDKSGPIQSTQGTADETGSGFGLKLIKDYVTRFRGKLEIISNQSDQDPMNQGTTVRLIFPKALK